MKSLFLVVVVALASSLVMPGSVNARCCNPIGIACGANGAGCYTIPDNVNCTPTTAYKNCAGSCLTDDFGDSWCGTATAAADGPIMTTVGSCLLMFLLLAMGAAALLRRFELSRS